MVVNQEDLLPELPPLADDGSLSDVDDGFSPDDSEHVADDRTSHDLALGALVDDTDDDASALDDSSSDIESASFATNDPESGWLDDAPMEMDMGVTFDSEDRVRDENDGGVDGIDEAPRALVDGNDDDASGLPSVPQGADGEGIDEPDVLPNITDD